MENKKIITRTIRIDSSNLPRRIMDVEQKVEFEKVNGIWLSEHSMWDKYQVPHFDGKQPSIEIIPAEQVTENTADTTINVMYYDVDNTEKNENENQQEKQQVQSNSSKKSENNSQTKKADKADKTNKEEVIENKREKNNYNYEKNDNDRKFDLFVKSLSNMQSVISAIDWDNQKASPIPFSKKNAWLQNVTEVQQSTKDLKEIGVITLNQNQFKIRYFSN